MSQSKQGSWAHIHLRLQEDCHGTSPRLLWDQEHCLHCGEKNNFTLYITAIKKPPEARLNYAALL